MSDKTQLDVLADILIESKVEVLSTGGTAKALRKFGVEVVPVSEYTGSPEILGGRVKTLHPKVHGGILALPTAAHQAELSLHGIAPIDLVVVNLYPFQKVTANPDCAFDDAIENIDIGGPTMVRAAAKSWQRVAVVVDPSDYAALGESLRANNFTVPEQDRLAYARKAFAHTAAYDAAIATYLHGEQPSAGGLHVAGAAQQELRYGENPHQKAHFYRLEVPHAQPGGLGEAVQLQGKPLSYNNFLDADG
ncbi:MAG: bifunctional phosphoribosylaminoimidazolecarboxamide formyltransferase/IMP cyclohydrolase, partial [Nannocystaceae bacterium]